MLEKYLIRKISAKTLIRYAQETENGYSFRFSEESTKRITNFSDLIIQED